MARPKNDGRGRIGGRQKGTPNKENPLKGYLKAQSLEYFEPKPQTNPDGSPRTLTQIVDGQKITVATLADKNGKPLLLSDFHVDLLQMKADDRVNAMIRLLEFHTPKMKAVDIDLNLSPVTLTIEDKLRSLSVAQDH